MAKKINITAEQLAQRWARGLQNANEKIQQGVEGVTEAPGKAAAAQKSVWLQNTQAAADKWANRVGAVPLEDWKQSMIQKGIPNLANSIELGRAKVQRQAARLIPAINELLNTMPKKGATVESNMNRVLHMAKGLKERFARG